MEHGKVSSECFISIKICFSDRIKDFEGEGVAKTRPKRAGSGESRRQRLQAGSLLSRRLNGFRQVGCAVSLRYRERIRVEGLQTFCADTGKLVVQRRSSLRPISDGDFFVL